MYSLAGLFWRNNLGFASVIPSEQTASLYFILCVAWKPCTCWEIILIVLQWFLGERSLPSRMKTPAELKMSAKWKMFQKVHIATCKMATRSSVGSCFVERTKSSKYIMYQKISNEATPCSARKSAGFDVCSKCTLTCRFWIDHSDTHTYSVTQLIPKTIGNRKRDCAWGCSRW